jgi:hypothetical protein
VFGQGETITTGNGAGTAARKPKEQRGLVVADVDRLLVGAAHPRRRRLPVGL